ncbi:MAG: alpha/beta hydrolase [Bacteroidales bacterium]|nr:alpha/beta hydrolase [Bacteroidales bacterium]
MKKLFLLTFAFLLILLIVPFLSEQGSEEGGGPEAPKGYRSEFFLKAAYALGRLDLIDMEPAIPEELKVYSDIEYKQVDSLSLKLDIYRLKKLADPVPVVIFIHGGSWKSGKRSDYLPYLVDYAMKGYVTLTVSYRLSKVALFPAAVQDVFCAIQWIRTHAGEYGIDPGRIALVGASAGAHLAMLAGYASDHPLFNSGCNYETGVNVNAVVNFYGPVDLTVDFARESGPLTEFIGKSYNEAPDFYRDVSPRTYITPDDPPTLTFHGTIDSLVPVSQADSLDNWLTRAGVTHEYHRLKGWPHAMDIGEKVNEYCRHYMDIFLKTYL